jgi:hypothetical protein
MRLGRGRETIRVIQLLNINDELFGWLTWEKLPSATQLVSLCRTIRKGIAERPVARLPQQRRPPVYKSKVFGTATPGGISVAGTDVKLSPASLT